MHPLTLPRMIPSECFKRPRFPQIAGQVGLLPLALLAMLPVWIWYIRRLNDGSDEPMGLVAVAFAAAIGWRDRAMAKPGTLSLVAGASLVLVSVLGIGLWPPMIRAALAVCGAGALTGCFRRPGLLGLLLLSLPVVASLQFYAGWPMRIATAHGVVNTLQLCGITAAVDGVRISIGGQFIGVDPACAGVRMMWNALAAAMLLGAYHRVSWRGTLTAAALAFALVIPANIFRALWLVLEQSGRITPSGLSHGMIGLLAFLILLIPLAWFIPRQAGSVGSGEAAGHRSRIAAKALLVLACLMLPWQLTRETSPGGNVTLPPAAAGIFTFDGLSFPLEPVPPTDEENAFSRAFPGSIATFGWNDKQVILRRVSKATRKLHPSADCLRAAGYRTSEAETVELADGTSWSRFTASRDGMRLTVHERIVSETDGSTWTDGPAWFWSALDRPLNGPWRAETVISE